MDHSIHDIVLSHSFGTFCSRFLIAAKSLPLASSKLSVRCAVWGVRCEGDRLRGYEVSRWVWVSHLIIDFFLELYAKCKGVLPNLVFACAGWPSSLRIWRKAYRWTKIPSYKHIDTQGVWHVNQPSCQRAAKRHWYSQTHTDTCVSVHVYKYMNVYVHVNAHVNVYVYVHMYMVPFCNRVVYRAEEEVVRAFEHSQYRVIDLLIAHMLESTLSALIATPWIVTFYNLHSTVFTWSSLLSSKSILSERRSFLLRNVRNVQACVCTCLCLCLCLCVASKSLYACICRRIHTVSLYACVYCACNFFCACTQFVVACHDMHVCVYVYMYVCMCYMCMPKCVQGWVLT